MDMKTKIMNLITVHICLFSVYVPALLLLLDPNILPKPLSPNLAVSVLLERQLHTNAKQQTELQVLHPNFAILSGKQKQLLR
jgi:hypothetical protein